GLKGGWVAPLALPGLERSLPATRPGLELLPAPPAAGAQEHVDEEEEGESEEQEQQQEQRQRRRRPQWERGGGGVGSSGSRDRRAAHGGAVVRASAGPSSRAPAPVPGAPSQRRAAGLLGDPGGQGATAAGFAGMFD
ncbi:hypothetical protein MNEG_9230, partial [Monoraphidium neglectum]